IPNTAVPAAPMPVQTAYAVPTGSDLRAIARHRKLAAIATTVSTDGTRREKPSLNFNPTAHAVSNRPATSIKSQAIKPPLQQTSLRLDPLKPNQVRKQGSSWQKSGNNVMRELHAVSHFSC